MTSTVSRTVSISKSLPSSRVPIPKTPTHGSKPGSRNGLPPAPQLVCVKYVIDADVIKCPSCMDTFKSPRCLPCGHSLCFQCLDSLIMSCDSSINKDCFACPVCFKIAYPRDTKMIRQRWAQQFPVNSSLYRLLRNAEIKNVLDNGTHKAFCEICVVNNKTRPTVMYCTKCLEHLCEVCSKYHEKQDDTKDHETLSFIVKEDPSEKQEAVMKAEWKRRSNVQQGLDVNERRVKIDPTARDGKLAPVGNVVVAQTVTAADSVIQKPVVRLGLFNGKAPTDSATSDFRSVTFLTNTKIVLGDFANKKLKVFDIAHKTRVELMTELALRADPIHMCRIDENTVAVVTERSGTFHIRLFTIRDKIMHFVHKTIDGVPLGIGFMNNTVICSFLNNAALHRYRLTKAQQLKVGTFKQDKSGNDIFHHPGAICSGLWRGLHVLYVADETEYGVTVCAIDGRGDRKSTVFFEIPVMKSTKRSANGVLKSGRKTKTGKIKTVKTEETLEGTIGKGTIGSTSKSPKQTARKSAGQSREQTPLERTSGHNTFRRVDDFGRTTVSQKGVREIERTPVPGVKTDLVIDLSKITNDDGELSGTIKSTAKPISSKAVERAPKRPVGKIIPQPKSQSNSRSGASSTPNLNSTVTSNSTIGTVTFQAPPKLVYRADSIDVDHHGNIYVCMSSMNKVHQMSPDGSVKRDLLTEKDGLVAPKVICFSPKHDFFVVTSLKNNKVSMFRLKQH